MRNFIQEILKKLSWANYLIIALAFNCFGQQNENSFNLVINFNPSFANQSTLLINTKKGSSELELIVYERENESKIKSREKVVIQESKLASIRDLLKTYDFRIKGIIDTLSSQRVLRNGDSTTAYKVSIGSDGISVAGSYVCNNAEQKFAFWSPAKDSDSYNLVQQIFALSNDSFRRKKSLGHIKTLQSYF